MKKLLLILPTFFLVSCAAPIQVKPWNPLRLLPGIKGTTSTLVNDTLSPGSPNYSWMFQVLAVASCIFAVGSSWIAGRITKRAVLVLISGLGFSIWGMSMEIIHHIIKTFLPWLVGGALIYFIYDLIRDGKLRWGK